MYEQYLYYPLYGIPVFAYFGIAAFLSLIVTISIPVLNKKRKKKIPLVWHHRMAFMVLLFVVLHVSSIIIGRI